MLWTIFAILLMMWLLGMISGYVIGGFVHILLIVALVVVLTKTFGLINPLRKETNSHETDYTARH